MDDAAPVCPRVRQRVTYERGALQVCSMCAHEWSLTAAADDAAAERVIRDSVGNVLADGDTVTVIKDLKVKGSSGSIKVGTNIRLTSGVGDHDIDCVSPCDLELL
jgi:protein PhnA